MEVPLIRQGAFQESAKAPELRLENILHDRESVRAIASARRPGIVMDFDGTLSEIAPNPDSALIEPRSAHALGRLVELFPLVAVLSGRRVRDLADRVGVEGVVYVGNHGAEYLVKGEYSASDDGNGDATGIFAILAHLKEALDEAGVLYEYKGFSASVHFRQAADPGRAARTLRRALFDAPGIERYDTFWGRRVLEIRPLKAMNKGHAVAALVEEYELDALAIAGDDTTDIDAIGKLQSMSGVRGIAVAVRSRETPSALLASASHAVEGVQEVGELLELLACLRGGSV